ncbi:cytidine/deoxycytidylate deaminase family protein [Aneurinibacillus sp. Ricciae_BoGa-3]|uniref:deoxycytidylate deaminase n=1 Tax=Aneurinibacillus sp. Ricciae_BoGa-3 TaxID=3022697 RepID=UPI00234188DB|nr:cytidine/deoxycytidylate deaminase family protein [Aneurinibacillus sp. Ricciae_BoGa-3]WCK53508.1 cytidine/deoxycytidylate deaminase family protein [Aneurinibacillus sp. Ricciae_BoGa-3]
MSKRKSWDEYFMDLAHMAATRSTCPRRHVGAVLIRDHKVLGTAYNGSPSETPSCEDEGCMVQDYYEPDERGEISRKQRCIRAIHAEQNLFLFTDQADRQGATLYVTDQPCWTCANMIANSGIASVVYHRPYRKDFTKVAALLAAKNIQFRQLDSYEPPQGIKEKVIE